MKQADMNLSCCMPGTQPEHLEGLHGDHRQSRKHLRPGGVGEPQEFVKRTVVQFVSSRNEAVNLLPDSQSTQLGTARGLAARAGMRSWISHVLVTPSPSVSLARPLSQVLDLSSQRGHLALVGLHLLSCPLEPRSQRVLPLRTSCWRVRLANPPKVLEIAGTIPASQALGVEILRSTVRAAPLVSGGA